MYLAYLKRVAVWFCFSHSFNEDLFWWTLVLLTKNERQRGYVLLTTLEEPSSTSLLRYNQKHFSPWKVRLAPLFLQDVWSYILDMQFELHCNFCSLQMPGTPRRLRDLHEECLTTYALNIQTSIQPCYNWCYKDWRVINPSSDAIKWLYLDLLCEQTFGIYHIVWVNNDGYLLDWGIETYMCSRTKQGLLTDIIRTWRNQKCWRRNTIKRFLVTKHFTVWTPCLVLFDRVVFDTIWRTSNIRSKT